MLLKKIISFANETEGLSLKAYALDALNRMDTKTDFRIKLERMLSNSIAEMNLTK